MKAKRTIFALLVAAVLLALAGCGSEQAVTVFNPKEDYDGFKQLAQQNLEGTGDMDNIILFVPKSSTSQSATYVSGSGSGVGVSISLVNSNTIKAYDKDPEKILTKSTYITSDYFSGVEKKASKLKTAQDGKAAYVSDYEIYKSSSGSYVYGYCKTDFVLKLDDDNFLYGKVTIDMNKAEDEDKNIKATIKELEQYYCVKIYYDKDKVLEKINSHKSEAAS